MASLANDKLCFDFSLKSSAFNQQPFNGSLNVRRKKVSDIYIYIDSLKVNND